MYGYELDEIKAAHKAAMDLAVKNAIFFMTWPFIFYSAIVLASNPPLWRRFSFAQIGN